MSTFVLVHGSWHGRWCWDRLVPLLERAGHRALAVDLPGRAPDTTPAAKLTLEACLQRVCDAVSGAGAPVVLVGHCVAGVVVTQAAETCPVPI